MRSFVSMALGILTCSMAGAGVALLAQAAERGDRPVEVRGPARGALPAPARREERRHLAIDRQRLNGRRRRRGRPIRTCTCAPTTTATGSSARPATSRSPCSPAATRSAPCWARSPPTAATRVAPTRCASQHHLAEQEADARDDAEALLRDNNLNLETTVDERTAELREANNEIQRFAYIVSHDLRSPLVNIMGFTSELEELRTDIFKRITTLGHAAAGGGAEIEPVALEAEDRQLSEYFSEALGFIKSSIGKMDRLISAILHLTREGRREFEPVWIDTKELIEGVVMTVAHQAAEAQAEIRIDALPNIVTDRLALEQIFSNLIDNALKYLKTGVPGEIRVRGRTKLGFAIFELSDNGRGIDPKDHQRIFELFRRAGTQDKPGQGIGLAHVRALVRRLGGTMSVASELHQGSTFTITLPINWPAGNRNTRT